MTANSNDAPIGVYDSGLGGLTVWREIRRMLPGESLVYLGDGANCPYGSRPREEVRALADRSYEPEDMTAEVASGSFWTDGMIVAPCSMKSLAGIVSGYSDNLLLRAADVCLKEGRRLVLVPRETPLGRVHLMNLCRAAELGCVIVPPMLTFYNGARTLSEQIDHIVGKVLLQFGLHSPKFRPWEGVED